jgi:tetratricopeptide (TPR) repeat protein
VYQAKGRYADAEPLFKESLAIVEKTRGPGHLDYSICLNNLAELYRVQGRYTEAEPLYHTVRWPSPKRERGPTILKSPPASLIWPLSIRSKAGTPRRKRSAQCEHQENR